MKSKSGNHHKRTKYRTFQEMVRQNPLYDCVHNNTVNGYPLEE
jgi:hypothetical protein